MSKPGSATDALEFLSKEQQIMLGRLHGADEEVVSQILTLLGFGSRTALRALNLVEYEAIDADGLQLTSLGRSVAGACYHRWSKLIEFEEKDLERARWCRVASRLPAELRQTLALFVNTETSVVELMIVLMPRDSREILAKVGAIETNLAAPLDDPVEVMLTDDGLLLIGACWFLEVPADWKEAVRELERAARHHYETLPEDE